MGLSDGICPCTKAWAPEAGPGLIQSKQPCATISPFMPGLGTWARDGHHSPSHSLSWPQTMAIMV